MRNKLKAISKAQIQTWTKNQNQKHLKLMRHTV